MMNDFSWGHLYLSDYSVIDLFYCWSLLWVCFLGIWWIYQRVSSRWFRNFYYSKVDEVSSLFLPLECLGKTLNIVTTFWILDELSLFWTTCEIFIVTFFGIFLYILCFMCYVRFVLLYRLNLLMFIYFQQVIIFSVVYLYASF